MNCPLCPEAVQIKTDEVPTGQVRSNVNIDNNYVPTHLPDEPDFLFSVR